MVTREKRETREKKRGLGMYYGSNPTSFSSNMFHHLDGTNEFGFMMSIFQACPYFHLSHVNGKKKVKSTLSLLGMEMCSLVYSKDLILTKLKKLEGAMFWTEG